MMEKEYSEKQKEKLEWLRREIQKGMDDIEAGRTVDGETFLKELLNRKATRISKSDILA